MAPIPSTCLVFQPLGTNKDPGCGPGLEFLIEASKAPEQSHYGTQVTKNGLLSLSRAKLSLVHWGIRMTIHRIDGTESYTWEGASWSGVSCGFPGVPQKPWFWSIRQICQPSPNFLACSWCPEPFLVILSLEVMKQPRCGDLEICTERVPSVPGLSLEGTQPGVPTIVLCLPWSGIDCRPGSPISCQVPGLGMAIDGFCVD